MRVRVHIISYVEEETLYCKLNEPDLIILLEVT